MLYLSAYSIFKILTLLEDTIVIRYPIFAYLGADYIFAEDHVKWWYAVTDWA
jgi:hypothetical protein